MIRHLVPFKTRSLLKPMIAAEKLDFPLTEYEALVAMKAAETPFSRDETSIAFFNRFSQ